jgi:hypothetical protein
MACCSQAWRSARSSTGAGISPTLGSTMAIVDHRDSRAATVSRARRNGLVIIGSGPRGARRSAMAAAWAVPTSSRPGSASAP